MTTRAVVCLALASFFLTNVGCSLSKHKSILKSGEPTSINLTDGIKAFDRGDLERARVIFNKIIDTRTDPSKLEESQWYLAQIAEKQGKRTEAIQQYRLFSKNFPSSQHIPEVKARLAALTEGANVQSSISPETGEAPVSSGAPPVPPPQNPFTLRRRDLSPFGRLSGAFTIEYLYDTQTSPPDVTPTVQNRLTEYLDMRWKKSMGGDLKIYVSGLYSHDFLIPDNSYYRLSKLFADWNDPHSIVDLRIGRQPSSGSTLFSRFDGVTMGLRPFNTMGLNASAGHPVDPFDRNQIQIQSNLFFYETYISIYDLFHLSGKIYYTQEFDTGFSTRNAVGLNGYWLNDRFNISSIVDYDLGFKEFNDKMAGLEYHYFTAIFSAAVEYRKNPFLDYETALFAPSLALANPPITSLDALRETLSRSDIEELAIQNTTDSNEIRVGAAFDITNVWRADLRYAHANFQSIVFNDGKDDKKGDRYSVFISERNGLAWSEIGTILYLFQPSTDYETTTVTGTFTKSWGIEFQTTLRCRWERFIIHTSNTSSTRITPGFSLIYTFNGGISATLDADYDIDQNTTTNSTVEIVETRTAITFPF